MPTKDVKEPSMDLSLSCGCELDVERRLWRLFGLVPESRRRSSFVTVLRDRGTIDLSPAAVGKPASLRSAAFPTAVPITSSLLEESNIQGHEGKPPNVKFRASRSKSERDFHL